MVQKKPFFLRKKFVSFIMVKFTIKEKVLCENLPKEAVQALKNKLTITNPAFSKQMQMQKSVWGIKQYVSYYRYISPTSIEIPTGFFAEALEILMNNFGLDITPDLISDERVEVSDEAFFKDKVFTGKLDPYQQDASDALLKHTVGVLKAKTGSGKTICLVRTLIMRKQNTLILVDTKELAEQMISAIIKFTNIKREEIGFIGSSKYIVKPITVGMLQTVTKLSGEKLKEVQKSFGQVVADETHIIAAETYFEAMSKLPAKYTYGVSATPRRDDGLTSVIFWATGPLIHEVPDKAAEKRLIIPSYEKVETEYYFPIFDTSEFHALVTDMATDVERNKLIYERFKKEEKIPSVFLCSRLTQVQILKDIIGDSAVMLTSEMKPKEREAAMNRLRSGDALHAVSTWGLFSKGVDIPQLANLYACSPMGSNNVLKQAGGRIMRKADDKTSSKVIDFQDPKCWILKSQIKKREKILRNL